MITVHFLKDQSGALLGFQLSGHAGAGEAGEDIVCSAVSALTINTVNSLEQFTDAGFEEDYDEKTGFMKVVLNGSACDHDAQLLMASLELGITQMAQSYPDHIRIAEDEV